MRDRLHGNIRLNLLEVSSAPKDGERELQNRLLVGDGDVRVGALDVDARRASREERYNASDFGYSARELRFAELLAHRTQCWMAYIQSSANERN